MKRNVLLLTLAMGILASSSAVAQSDLGLRRVGVAIGFVSPEGLDGTIGLGIFADHGTLAPRIGLESRLDYWSQSQESFGSTASVSDLAIGARGKYSFEVANPKIRPFAGAGLGFHFVHAEATIPAQFGFPQQRTENSSTRLGLDLGGGMSTPLGPRTDFLAAIWYGVVTDVSHFSLRAGISRKLKP